MLANWIIEDAYIGRFIFCFIYAYAHFLSFLPAHIKTVKYDVKNLGVGKKGPPGTDRVKI